MTRVGPAELTERLTTQEASSMTIGPSITTITFMRGPNAASWLRGRLTQLVEHNPWLAGTLVTKDKALHLSYPAQPSAEHIDRLFNPGDSAPALSSTMGILQLCQAVGGSSAEVPKGSECIDKPRPLAALSVVPDTSRPEDTFAIVFSLSHVIADGWNYYQLLAMLSQDGTIAALNPIRKHEIVQRAREAVGEQESALCDSKALMCNVVGTMICGRTPAFESFYVDPSRVNAAKAAATGAPFVSTNDVLVSSFGNSTGSRVLLMPINFRNKLEGFVDSDAGNYEGALVFGPDDYADPGLVRNTLSSGGPSFRRGAPGEATRALPGCCESLWMRIGMVTNWAFQSFSEVSLEGCQQMLHIPHCDPGCVPFEAAVVYRPRAGQLAVACFLRSVTGEVLQQGCPLAGSVSCAEDSFVYAPAS